MLGTMVFVLPVESGEKNGFSLTILLSMSVVMTILSDHIPPISTQTCQLSKFPDFYGHSKLKVKTKLWVSYLI